jgi:SAM-dependent methyltransferase
MSRDEEACTSALYRARLATYGANHLALNWGSEAGQTLRFSVLAGVGDMRGRSVLDVGCGLGDFAGWLDANDIAAEYVGLDLTADLVAVARQRHPGRRFVHGSITDPAVLAGDMFDFVVASGIFATYHQHAQSWMERAVTRMWSLARHGVAFNSLSSWSPTRDPGEYYANPETVLSFCRSLTTRIAMRHDYHPRDFTVFLHRGHVA